jgi:hypothetical protein
VLALDVVPRKDCFLINIEASKYHQPWKWE